MKTTMIKRAALAAAILAGVGMAYGENMPAAVVYCTGIITSGTGSGEAVVSVSLPPTEGYYDDEGNPVTIWNVGKVPPGGVADSWHGEGGPGRFTARNTGNVGAYLYVTTRGVGDDYMTLTGLYSYPDGRTSEKPHVMSGSDISLYLGLEGEFLRWPCISPKELWSAYAEGAYHLAFTTDTMAKVPTWHSLDHRYAGGEGWTTQEGTVPCSDEIAGFMGRVDAGDYLTFDLKFWAPPVDEGTRPCVFTFCVEASSFPLWDHGRAVE